jgi:hypothetical protein
MTFILSRALSPHTSLYLRTKWCQFFSSTPSSPIFPSELSIPPRTREVVLLGTIGADDLVREPRVGEALVAHLVPAARARRGRPTGWDRVAHHAKGAVESLDLAIGGGGRRRGFGGGGRGRVLVKWCAKHGG